MEFVTYIVMKWSCGEEYEKQVDEFLNLAHLNENLSMGHIIFLAFIV